MKREVPKLETRKGGRVVYARGPIIRFLGIVSVISGLMAVAALITVIVLFSVSTDRIAEGRRVGVGVTCAVASATSKAGFDVITQGQLPDSGFTRFLERHGYPPRKQRVAAAQAAGTRYVRELSNEVAQRIGTQAMQVVGADGSLNCQEVEKLAKVR